MSQVYIPGFDSYSHYAKVWGKEVRDRELIFQFHQEVEAENRGESFKVVASTVQSIAPLVKRPKPRTRRARGIYRKPLVIQTWREAAKEKRLLEKWNIENRLPSSLRARLDLLRRAARDRGEKHASLLNSHANKRFFGMYPGMLGRSDIPKGVKCATSIKQLKIRSVIPDTAAKYKEGEIIPLYQEPQRLPRQARFGSFLDKLAKRERVNIGVLGQPNCSEFRVRSTVAALCEGLLRAYVNLLAIKDPCFAEALENEMFQQALPNMPQWSDEECLSRPKLLKYVPKSRREALNQILEKRKIESKEREIKEWVKKTYAKPNMETAHGETGDIQSEQQGNVVLSAPNVKSKAPARLPNTKGFLSMTSAKESQTFQQITSRWLKYNDQVVWSTSDVQDKELIKLKLPFDILNINQNSPNVLPFMIHKFARFGMKIMIAINSNKFQCGQLQASWMYNSHVNSLSDEYSNIWCASQRRHVIISAGASNWAELDIPYWAVTSSINLKNNSDELDQGSDALALGELSIRVLSPLNTTSTSFKSANLNISVCFMEPEFRGLCDRGINSPFKVTPNMEELVNTTESILHIVKPVLDMDKPLKPEVAALVQPQASHSFGTTRRQNEILNSLRGNPLSQTPGLVFGDGQDGQIRSLLDRWSLVTSFPWENTRTKGYMLFKLDSAPIFQKSTYKKSTFGDNDFYYLPIIAVLSSMFCYWRGDIEIRLDFVCTQFHSGSIMIATIPGAEGDEDIEVAKNSAYQVFSLMDTHQVTYRIPYYNNVAFSKTKHNLDRSRDVAPPSRTLIYVYNPLIPMDQVPTAINVNLYVRAAPNFELSILRTPSLALGFNKTILKPTSTAAWVDPSWSAMFTAGSRWTNNYLCLFYNETTDYFTLFLNLKPRIVYIVPSETTAITIGSSTYNFRVRFYSTATALANVTHIVKCEQYSQYPVVCCFNDLTKARAYAADPTQAKLTANGLKEVAQGPWAEYKLTSSSTWTNIPADMLSKIPFNMAPASVGDWEMIATPNMEEQETVIVKSITLDKPASTTGCGDAIFGERVSSLEEACKRWQHCGCGKLPSSESVICLSQAPCLARISTHPLRSFIPSTSADRDNRLRDGLISICTSSFAGYRGSMRYRIVVNGASANNLSFAVVHKFDKRVNFDMPTVSVVEEKNRDAQDYFDTAYAACLQSTYVNNVLEFEVPFYNRGEYNSAYRSKADTIYILDNYQMSGEIRLYVSGMVDSTISFDVYYSIGDDFAFSNFQGFPRMFFLDEIPAEPNMESEYVSSLFHFPESMFSSRKFIVNGDTFTFGNIIYKFNENFILPFDLLGKADFLTIYSVNIIPRGVEVYLFKDGDRVKLRYNQSDWHIFSDCDSLFDSLFIRPLKVFSESVLSVDKCDILPDILDKAVDALDLIDIEDEIKPNMEYVKSFFTFPKKLGDACTVIKDSVGTMGSKVVDSLSSVADTVSKVAKAPFSGIAFPSFTSLLQSCGGFAHMLLTQLLHIMAKPYCKTTLVIAVFSIMCTVLSDKICILFEKLKEAFRYCWQWLFGKNKQNTPDEGAISPNLEEEDTKATFLSLLWSIVATIAGYIGKAPKNIKDFTLGLFAKSSDVFRTHVFGVKFFKDFLELLKRMWSWINVKLGLQKPLYKLTSNDKFLQEWALSAAVLLSPENKDLVLTSKEWVSKLFEIQIIGRLIKQAAINTSKHITRDLYNMINDTQRRLTERVDELIKRKCYVPIRQEPFIVWFVGEPGVGKSHLAQHFMRRLAKDYCISPDIFSLVAGQKYYDLLQYQKFVLLDDFLNWTGDSAEEVFGQYLQMSGTNMLSLPRAVAQDKAVLDNFEFLFVTANQMWFDQECAIKEPDAYNRRRNLSIKIRLRKEFLKGFVSEKAAAQAYRKLPDDDKNDCQHIYFEVFENDSNEVKHIAKNLDEIYILIKSYSDIQRQNASVKYFRMVEEHMNALDKSASDVSSFAEFFNKMDRLCSEVIIGDMNKQISETGTDSINWIAERLKSRYCMYDESNSTNSLPNINEAKAFVIRNGHKIPISTTEEPECSAASPNGDEIRIESEDLDGALQGLMAVANKASEIFDRLKNRFEEPILGIYTIPDLPEMSCEKASSVRPMCGVFEDGCLCPHRRFKFCNSYFYKFSEQMRECVKTTYKVNPSPEGIFIDPRGSGHYYAQVWDESFACFSAPCTLEDGNIDPNCSWVDKEEMKNDLCSYWNSLVGVLHYKLPSWKDFLKVGKLRLYTMMPSQLFCCLENIYEKDKKFVLNTDKGIIAGFLFTIKNGFCADRVIVDGVNHGVYPTRREVEWGVRDGEKKELSRSKGILFDDVSYVFNGEEKKQIECNFLCKSLIAIGLIIAALSGLIAFVDLILCFLEYWGVFSLWEWNKGKCSENMSSSGDFKTSKQAAKGTVKAINLLKGNANNKVDECDGRLNKIISNSFYIVALSETETGVKKTLKARCLGIYGYTAIVLNHYIEAFANLCLKQPKTEFFIIRKDSQTKEPLDFQRLDFEVPSEGGYCTMTLPKGGMQFKDIRKFIPKEGVANYPSKAKLVEVFVDKVVETNLDIKLTFRKQLVAPDIDSGMSAWEIHQKFEYKDKAGNGICGAFLYAEDLECPLIGIHTAGLSNKVGFSEILLRETFKQGDKEHLVEFVTPNLKLDEEAFQPEGPHISVGHVDKKDGVILPSKSRIVPSKAFGIFPTYTEPAPLSLNDVRIINDHQKSPLEYGIEKRCDLVRNFNGLDIANAKEDVRNLILTKNKPVRAITETLSVKQAIEGIEGIIGMEPIEMKTSEGYPWVKERPKGYSDKRWMFDMDYSGNYPICKGINDKLQRVIEIKDKMRVQNIVPPTYFTACLKDARISKDKVKIPGKTRIFEMSPIDLTIAQRRYNLDFYASYMHCRRDLENTIGINVNGKEWSLLAEDLISFSPHILGGDYSSYGPKMPLEILHNVWDIIVDWYELNLAEFDGREKHLANLRTMKFECLNSLLIVTRYVMRCLGGMHSGNVATVILNSLCNSMLVRIAYIGIMRKYKPTIKSLIYFNKFVKMFSNGDDLIIAVKPEIIDIFNNVTISEFFALYNIKYTNSKKDQEIVPFESILSVSYLKCGFFPHPTRTGEWLAQLSKESIYDCCQWVWNKDLDPWEATIQNCDQAIRLSYGWGKEFFDVIRNTISNFLIKNNKYVVFPTWEDLDDNVWSDGLQIVSF